MGLIDRQLDALRNTELDKELMQSLRASNLAMKRAGLADGVDEAEKVMNELDDQIREASELTSVLAGPLPDPTLGLGAGLDEELNRELDEELALLEEAAEPAPAPALAPAPAPPPRAPLLEPAPRPQPAAAAPRQVSAMLDF
jgi:hypothetical protein